MSALGRVLAFLAFAAIITWIATGWSVFLTLAVILGLFGSLGVLMDSQEVSEPPRPIAPTQVLVSPVLTADTTTTSSQVPASKNGGRRLFLDEDFGVDRVE